MIRCSLIAVLLSTQAVLLAHGQVVAQSSPAAAHDELVNGIKGSLVLTGDTVSDSTLQYFINLARREQSRIVVVSVVGRNNALMLDQTSRLMKFWQLRRGKSFQVFRVNEEEDAQTGPAKDAIEKATGVWLIADQTERAIEVLKDTKIDVECRRVLDRNGVVGTSRRVSPTIVQAPEEISIDLGLSEYARLTNSIFGYLWAAIHCDDGNFKSRQEFLRKLNRTHAVGFELSPDASLVVRGRRVIVTGGTIDVHLAKSSEWPDFELELNSRRRFADLTALRRFAVQRQGPLFPPKEAAKPVVPKGTLVIVGGGGMPKGLINRFVESAGGDKASIVVIPISSTDPLPPDERLTGWIRTAGAKNVTVLRGRTPAAVNDEASLKALREATGIWFGGGRQWRFIDAYEGTEAAELMHDVLKRGGVIGGSSAGASIQGEYMARGNPLGSRDIMADGYERGLNFLPGVAIDQHFSQRKRQKDLASLVDRYPQLLGIGIDETTAIVVTGHTAEIVGRHAVHFYDRNKPVEEGKPDHESVHPGGKYDLAERKILDPGKPVKPAKKTDDAKKKKSTAQ